MILFCVDSTERNGVSFLKSCSVCYRQNNFYACVLHPQNLQFSKQSALQAGCLCACWVDSTASTGCGLELCNSQACFLVSSTARPSWIALSIDNSFSRRYLSYINSTVHNAILDQQVLQFSKLTVGCKFLKGSYKLVEGLSFRLDIRKKLIMNKGDVFSQITVLCHFSRIGQLSYCELGQ